MTAAPPTSRPRAADSGDRREPHLPRWLLVLGVPTAGLVLVAFFVFLRFPFDRFGDALARQAGAALGAEVSVAELEPTVTRGGPGLVLRGVRIVWPDGARAAVERAALRPAWSPSWLRGRPALHVDADADLGRLSGSLTLGAEPGFDGRLEAVALDRLPLDRLARGAGLDGRLDLDADLRLREGLPVGEARFEARDGSLAAPGLPIAIPYRSLHGTLRFGEDGSLTIEEASLEGPMVSGQVRGGTAPGPSLWLAPLDLDVHLQVSDRNLRPSFRSIGLALKPDGSTDLKVQGNLAAPVIR